MKDNPEATERWRRQMARLRLYSSYQDAVGIDGEAIEFEWNILPGFLSKSILQETQKDLAKKNIQSKQFKDRIIVMSMFSDIVRKKNDENCISNAEEVRNHALKLPKDIGHFWVQGRKTVVWKFLLRSKKGEWDSTTSKMVQRFKETRHLVVKSISALCRGILKQKKGKNTIHFNGDSTNTELLSQTMHYGNQLSIYAAVTKLVSSILLDRRRKETS